MPFTNEQKREYDKTHKRKTVHTYCPCGGEVFAFSTDLVQCDICGREYVIVRRGRENSLLPVRQETVDDDGWETEVEQALRMV